MKIKLNSSEAISYINQLNELINFNNQIDIIFEEYSSASGECALEIESIYESIYILRRYIDMLLQNTVSFVSSFEKDITSIDANASNELSKTK